LDFGVAVFPAGELDQIGSEPPADSVVAARLITPLDSGAAAAGDVIEAELTRPLFSSEHRLIYPVGSILRGEVIDATPARSFHRNGQLAFSFNTLEAADVAAAGAVPSQEVEGSLFSAQVSHELKNLRINENGARIVESKTRFIGPAWAFIKVDRALNASADSFDDAILGAYRSKFLKEAIGQESRFGLPGSITGAMVPPVAIGMGIYGAARSVYSNFLGRGRNITLPANTPLQIRLINE
jgi:hypothetical protein